MLVKRGYWNEWDCYECSFPKYDHARAIKTIIPSPQNQCITRVVCGKVWVSFLVRACFLSQFPWLRSNPVRGDVTSCDVFFYWLGLLVRVDWHSGEPDCYKASVIDRNIFFVFWNPFGTWKFEHDLIFIFCVCVWVHTWLFGNFSISL